MTEKPQKQEEGEQEMSSNYTPKRIADFESTLEQIRQDGGWAPSGGIYTLAQAIWPWAAMELVVTNRTGLGPWVLLARYKGKGIPEHYNRFHIPGGFGFEKGKPMVRDIHEWCSRVAKGELGVDVEVLGTLGFHFWTPDEHPSGGRLVSQYVAVELLGEIKLDDDLGYFRRAEMLALGPEDMVQNHPHRNFLDQYLAALARGPVVPMNFGM